MSAYISTTIADYDVDGKGDTIDEALDAIAKECERAAENHELTAHELRKTAKRFRAMREVKW
jgi:hypothetical protein